MTKAEPKPRNLNKQLLAESLADRMGLSRSVAAEAVETMCDIIALTVAQGGSVSITNFISMDRVEKKPRTARNPHNGERIVVPAHRSVKVTVSPRLNHFANSPNPELTTIRKRPKGPSQK